MRRARLAPLLLVLLAACGREEPAPVPEAASSRDRAVPIASTTRGAPADLAGEWVIAQAVPGPAFAAPGARVEVRPGVDGAVLWRFAGPGGTAVVLSSPGRPGRYLPQRAGDPELWVLWVDDDFRTAAVGSPDGSLGWIMNRPGAASPDRTAAAREVLDWSGYDLGRLGPGA